MAFTSCVASTNDLGDDLQSAIINGRVVMRDRRVLTLHEQQVLRDARGMGENREKAVAR